jgi:hypothetical protein
MTTVLPKNVAQHILKKKSSSAPLGIPVAPGSSLPSGGRIIVLLEGYMIH